MTWDIEKRERKPTVRLLGPRSTETLQYPYEQAVLVRHRLRRLRGKREQARQGIVGSSYRWAAMSRHAASLQTTLILPFEEREDVWEEADLFGLFVNAVSAIDCLLYTAYLLASLRRRPAFPLEREGHYQQIAPRPMATRFGEQYPGEPITDALWRLAHSAGYDRMRVARNHLAHRAGVPRLQHFTSTERWMTWGIARGEEVRLTPEYVDGVHQLATAWMWRLMCGIDAFSERYFETHDEAAVAATPTASGGGDQREHAEEHHDVQNAEGHPERS